jgi:putative hydrolase of the HAD superfamily
LKKTLRCALFDLDNTLYPHSCGLWDEIGNRIDLYMIERLGMSPHEVGARRQDFLKAFGTTLNALRRYYDVDPDEFLNFVHDIPLGRYIQYDPELDRLLEKLKLRKIIFTNADAQHARRVLSRLGILRHFDFIIDIHLLDFINKPDGRSYLKALEFASVRPEECLLFEDSLVNIAPARQLGMTTVLVGGDAGQDGAHHHVERVTDLITIADFGLPIAD